MSKDRIKEQFSAYYEGTLDPGMRQSIEARLNSDSTLRAEYDEFVRIYSILKEIHEEPIEIPNFLSDRIATKLATATPTKPAFSFFTWSRGLGLAALGLVAISSAIFAIQNREGASISTQAGIGLTVSSKQSDILKVAIVRGEPVVQFMTSTPKTLLVTDAEDKKVLKRYDSPKDEVNCALTNPRVSAAVFQIDLTGEDSTFVFVPGVNPKKDTLRTGSGTLFDLLKKVADEFGVSIQFKSSGDPGNATWAFSSGNAFDELRNALKDQRLSISQMPDGLFIIEDR